MNELVNAAVAESMICVAKHYNTTVEMVKLAIRNGNEKVKTAVMDIAKGAIELIK